MNKLKTMYAVVCAAMIGLTAMALQPIITPTAAAAMTAAELKRDMRKLWEDHITYTRNYIISALAGLDDAKQVAQRLLENQDEIGKAIVPFYGDEAGKKLASLLRDHILIAADVVKAAKADDQEQLKAEQKKWRQNADDIAAFLSKANPNWPEKDLKAMLHEHLALTTDEVVGRIKKDWAADIAAYDKGHVHILKLADALATGIAKQFPDKLKGA
jgi:hypothetical protein